MPTTFSSRRRGRMALLWGCAVLSILVPPADGQMFGPRTLGRTLRRQTSPGVDGDVGTLRNQRFIRGNRRRTDFVGADRVEARDFVGVQQSGAVGAVRSAVTSALGDEDASGQVNQPLRRAGAERPYEPRLEIGFDYRPPPTPGLAAELTRQLATLTAGIEVSVEGRTAILRGVVASAEDRQLAELLASFEPGVSRVQNELAVAGDRQALPPVPRPRD